jgi:hypothetical protein
MIEEEEVEGGEEVVVEVVVVEVESMRNYMIWKFLLIMTREQIKMVTKI